MVMAELSSKANNPIPIRNKPADLGSMRGGVIVAEDLRGPH